MKIIAAGLAALLLSSTALPALAQATPAEVATPSPDPALAALLADYEDFLKANDPVSAGQEGDLVGPESR